MARINPFKFQVRSHPQLTEAEYSAKFAVMLKNSIMFEKMLSPMGDMTDGSKLGIRYSDRTLYIDKPSVFQGAARWLYGQTRDKIKEYIDTEIMSQTQNGYMALLIEIRDTSNDVILYACTKPPTDRGGVAIVISNEIRTGYRNLCAMNVALLERISHGLYIISEIYEKDTNDNYFDLVKVSLKKERLLLEAIVEKFAYIIT
jgi:hypothetical protein